MTTTNAGIGLAGILSRVQVTFARLVTGVALQFGIVVLVARVLGPTGNGRYTMSVLLPGVLVMLLNLGVPSSIIYHVAGRRLDFRQGRRLALRILLVMIPVGWAVGGTCVLLFRHSVFPGVGSTPLLAGVAFFPVALWLLFSTSFLQARQDFKSWNTVQLVPPAVSLAVLAALALTGWLNVFTAVIAWGIGQAAGALIAQVALSRSGAMDEVESGTEAPAGEVLRYGVVSQGSNLLTWLNYRMDIFLVNLICGPLLTGLYAVAVQIGERFWLISHATGAVLFPRLSQLEGNEEERRRLTPIATRWVTYFGLLAALLVIPLARPAIGWVFGQEYARAAVALLWLLPGLLAHNVTRILANDLAGRGRPGLNLVASLATFVVNLVGNLILIPRHGMAGAAIATSIAYSTTLVFCLVFYARTARVRWWRTVLPSRYDLHLLRRLFGAAPAKED